MTIGVDTHSDVHVAAALDQAGRPLGVATFPASTRGYAQLASWAESFGTVDKVGVGRHRQLRRRAAPVPGRLRPGCGRGRPALPQLPSRNGKSDPLDAASARAVLSGPASGTPKTGTPRSRWSASPAPWRHEARIQAGAQIDAVITSAPESVRAPLC